MSLPKPSALVQIDGVDGDDLVAVDQRAVAVDGQDTVGVAVEREPGVGAVVDDGALEVARVSRAAALVDVGAVGLGVEHDDARAEPAQHVGGDGRRRPVGAVDHEPQAGQVPPSIDCSTASA